MFVATASREVRRRLGTLVEAALDRVFDEPLDVPTGSEARRQLEERSGEAWTPAGLAAVDWAVARAARMGVLGRVGRRVAGRTGARVAGRALLPLSMALEVGLTARRGVHELQVLASFLIARFREAGVAFELELVRRAVTALYLQPGASPDLSRSGADLTASIARRWATQAVPGLGFGQTRENRRRVRAVERLEIGRLAEEWARVPSRP
jgi:hypothetical protein